MIALLLLAVMVEIQIVASMVCGSNSHGYVFSSLVTLSTSGLDNNNTISNIESQVYNYSLSRSFLNGPSVIIGITSFSSAASQFLMLAIKPMPISSLTSLSFLVRYYFKYTSWTLISFYFLAEDRMDLDSNYFQIDTRELATSQNGKAIQIQLPISTSFNNFQTLYFLNGYEIASLQSGNICSPFQVQLISLSQGQHSLTLIVSATTQTQVYSLLVSYLAFDNSSSSFSSGKYQYSSLSTASYLSVDLSLTSPISFIFAGINGFILPNNQANTQLTSSLINGTLQIQANPAINYLTLQYFVLYEPQSVCFYCQNAPFLFQGSCVASCPNNTEVTPGFCVSCSQSQLWNGSSCVNRCFGGRLWNSISQSCNCLGSSNWDGLTCVFCPLGQLWLISSLKCGCSSGQYWNTYACVPIPACPSSQLFDTLSQTCTCSNGSYFNGYQCITCNGGTIFDSINSICTCPSNTAWNGTNCNNICTSPFVANNGQCVCPSGTVISNDTCLAAPVCPSGMAFVNNACQNISCTPGFVWNGNSCIQYTPSCALGSYWNGQVCASFTVQCPSGSFWNGSYCLTSSGCPQGSYILNGQCTSFPQLCLSNYVWNGSNCLLVGIVSSCTITQYYNGSACVDANCSNGKVWNISLVQCICPFGSYWNGNTCITCPTGQIYGNNGCSCLTGYFLVDGTCYSLQQIYCQLVPNSQWNGASCVCNPGFQAIGINCACNGLIVGTTCNPCFNMPNSQFLNGSCQCMQGFYMLQGQCQAIPNPNTKPLISCNPGTLPDPAFKLCLPCSDGCLSCITQTVCIQCRPQYNYNWATYQCNQICGDGKRFSLPCDDGNSNNGDGCSSDCRIEPDFTCFGGSPNSADYCSKYLPQRIVLNLTGTTHLFGKIIANVRSNYLPSNLTNPSLPCADLCQQILTVSLTGYSSYPSIAAQYLVGSSSFSFSIEIDFGAQPISAFTLSVGVNPTVSQLYFPTVDSSLVYSFSINPAFLSLAQPSDPSTFLT